MRFSLASLLFILCLAGCRFDTGNADLAALKAEVAQLRAAQSATSPAAPAPELGQQMLELQIRHARLWQAGEARNWMLTQFQLAELPQLYVTPSHGDQPRRLAEVLPQMMDPALAKMQLAVDGEDGAAFDAAYDQLSDACTACHASADHGFLVIQRPRTPVLDNLRAQP